MPMIRAMRLLNAVEGGTTSGAQLQTLLTADPGRLAEFNVLMGMRGQTRRMAASSTAMAAVAASSTAMAAVIASSTAMAAVIASSTAMTAIATSTTAKLALYESDTALTACFNSTTAMTALRAAATIYSKAGNGTSPVLLNNGVTPGGLTDLGKYLLLGISGFATSARTITVSTLRGGSSRPNAVSSSGFIGTNATAGALLCCPITGPLSFVGNNSGTGLTYFSLLRCDV